PDRVMGIDLGVRIPATASIHDLPYSIQFVGNPQEVEVLVDQMNDRKSQLQQTRKRAGTGSGGPGTKPRLKPITKMKRTIENDTATKNQKWSKYIIDYAVKNGVGIIQIEDLTGISTDNMFLKDWKYFDLQQKIQYKAQEVGIDVVKVPP